MHPQRIIIGFLLLLTAGAHLGCRSFDPIRTDPPEAAPAARADTLAGRETTTLYVALRTDPSSLPSQIQQLRFRVSQIILEAEDGSRLVRELPHTMIRLNREADTQLHQLLQTSIGPAAYDHLTLQISDVYATYSPNAGGPLTVAVDEPLEIPLSGMDEAADNSLLVELQFNAAASLQKIGCCRWHFAPAITAQIKEDVQTP